MKKISLSFLFTLSVLIFGCQKEKELQPSTNNTNSENSRSPQQKHNERSITVENWNQLPADLRNAKKENPVENSESGRIAAVYKYPIGPWGGTTGGSPYSMYPLGANDKIYAIGGRGTTYVEGFVVWYITPTGSIYYYAVGNTTGLTVYYFYSNEYVYMLGGRAGTVINKMTIYTQAGTFDDKFSFGATGEDQFLWNVVANEQVLGFYGRASSTAIIQWGGYVYSL